ncbi:hypothetical protein ACWD4N_46490 [Streptomyces sp. NPDC002586]
MATTTVTAVYTVTTRVGLANRSWFRGQLETNGLEFVEKVGLFSSSFAIYTASARRRDAVAQWVTVLAEA